MRYIIFIVLSIVAFDLMGQGELNPEQIREAPGGRDYILLSTDTLNSSYPLNGIFVYSRLRDSIYIKGDSLCHGIFGDGRPDPCVYLPTGTGITDSNYYWIAHINGGLDGIDTITAGQTVDLVPGSNITIVRTGARTYQISGQDGDTDADSLKLLGYILHLYEDDKDRTVDLSPLVDSVLANLPADTACLQSLLVMNDTTFGITHCNSSEIKDTICIVGMLAEIGDTDIRLDTVWRSNDTLYFQMENKEGVPIDTLFVVIPDSDNQTLTWDNGTRTLSISGGNSVVIPTGDTDTDDQTIDVFTFDNGTRTLSISLEDDGEATKTVVIPGGVDTYLDSVRHITVGVLDSIWLYRDSLGFLVDSFLIVLNDSVIPDTDTDTYIDSVRHITVGLLDSIWLYRDSANILVDSFLITLNDSINTASSVIGFNGLSNETPDSIKLGGQLVEDTRIRGNEDLPGLNEYSMYFDTLKNFEVSHSTRAQLIKIRDKTLSNTYGYVISSGDQTSNFYYDFAGNNAGRFLINTLGTSMGWGDSSSVIAKSHIYLNNQGTHINPEDQAGDALIDSLDILTAMNADGRALWQSAKEARLRDYDYAHLQDDISMTLIDTLLPLDSISIYRLVWRNGQVRLGKPEYPKPIGYTAAGTSHNTTLLADSNTVALAVHGKRSAIDIFYDSGFGTVGPYLHFRNQHADFYHRIINTTGEEGLQPMRYDIGAVAAYLPEGEIVNDTTDRAIFTIRANSDAGTLNLIDNYIQSDIYTTLRPPDTTNVIGLFAADEVGQFVLVSLDSIGDVNVLANPDHDWYVVNTTDQATAITQAIWTDNHVHIGGDEDPQSMLYVESDTLLSFETSVTGPYNTHTHSNADATWVQAYNGSSGPGGNPGFHLHQTEPADGYNFYIEEGYTGTSGHILNLLNNGDISMVHYQASRDDLPTAAELTRVFYPETVDWGELGPTGFLRLASIDTLAKAIFLTGIFGEGGGGDYLGTLFPSGQVVYGDGTAMGASSSDFVWNSGSRRMEVNGITGTSSIVLDNDRYYGTKTGGGVVRRVMGASADNDVSIGALDDFAGKVFFKEDGNTIMTLHNSRVGINTATPNRLLDVQANADVAYNTAFFAANQTTTTFTSTFSGFYSANTSGVNNSYARINLGDGSDAASAAIAAQLTNTALDYADLVFWTRGSGGFAERMRMGQTGQLKLNNYTGTTFDAGATKILNVDGSGNVQTTTASQLASFAFGHLDNYQQWALWLNNTYQADVTSLIAVDFIESGLMDITYSAAGGQRNITFSASIPTGHITSAMIADASIIEADLGATNAPTAGYVLTYDSGSGGFTWVNPASYPNQTITLSGDVTGTGTSAITTAIAANTIGPTELVATAVTAGSYTNADITVDADGRITAAANGSAGGGGLWSDGGTYIYPTTTSDFVVIGSSSTSYDTDELNVVGNTAGIDLWGLSNSSSPTSVISFKNDNMTNTLKIAGKIEGAFNTLIPNEGSMIFSWYEGNIAHQFLSAGTTNGTILSATTLRSRSNVYLGNINNTNDDLGIANAPAGAYLFHENQGSGTASDDSYISLQDNNSILIHANNAAATGFVEIASPTTINLKAPSTYIGNDATHQLYVRSDGTAAKIGHKAQGNSFIQFQQSQGNIVISNSAVVTSQISIASAGNLSLNSTSGVVQVNLSDFRIGADLTGTFDLEVNGTQASSSAATFTVVSDRRLKENIIPINDAYEKIGALNPVKFHYTKEHIDNNELRDYERIGFIAQDFKKVFPDYVDEQEYMSINHDAIGPYTVAAVQQLIKDKETLQSQISVLMTQIEKLNNRLTKLENE